MCASMTATVHTYSSMASFATTPVTANNTTSAMGSKSQLSAWQRVLLIWHTISLHWKRRANRHLLTNSLKFKVTRCQKSPDSHRDICKSRPHHEVEDPGLQLQDVGRREHNPSSGQNKEEDRRKEGQESFVKAVVFQRVTAISSVIEKKTSEWMRTKTNTKTMNCWLTLGHCRGSLAESQWRNRLEIKRC